MLIYLCFSSRKIRSWLQPITVLSFRSSFRLTLPVYHSKWKSRIKLFLDITSVFLCQITFSQESFLFLLSHFRIWIQLQQGRVFLRLSFQQLSSVFRVSFQSARKKPIIMRICKNNAYWLGMMDLAILALKAYMGKPKESFIKKVTSNGV